MKAYRAAILRFDDEGNAVYEKDGLLVTGPDAGHTNADGAMVHCPDVPSAAMSATVPAST